MEHMHQMNYKNNIISFFETLLPLVCGKEKFMSIMEGIYERNASNKSFSLLQQPPCITLSPACV